MGATTRRSIALAIAGAGLSGATLLSSGAAEAAAPAAPQGAMAASSSSPICRYRVTPWIGLNVRVLPNGRIVGALRHNHRVMAKKCRNPRGWVRLRGGVRPSWMGRFVFRPYLQRVR
ncbi:hypothetical protein AB0L06_33590 [Spirillospora sp. NPDC052269]